MDYWKDKYKFRDINSPVVKIYATQRWNFFLDKINKIAPSATSKISVSILDVGTGNGVASYYLKKYLKKKNINIFACDKSLYLLEMNPISKKICCNLLKLPLKDNTFDIVNVWEVLHHLNSNSLNNMIKELYRITKNILIICEPNPYNIAQFIFSLLDKEHRKVLKYNKKLIMNKLKKYFYHVFHFKGGLIFPNRTPLFIANCVNKFPYELFGGITNVFICKK